MSKLNRLLWYIFVLNSLIQDLCQLFSIYSNIYYKTILWRFAFNLSLWGTMNINSMIMTNSMITIACLASLTPCSQIIQCCIVLHWNKVPRDKLYCKRVDMIFVLSNVISFAIHMTVIWKYIFIQVGNPWFEYVNKEEYEMPYSNTEPTYIIMYNITLIISLVCLVFWIHKKLKYNVRNANDILYETQKMVLYLSILTDFMYTPIFVFRSIFIQNSVSYFAYFCHFSDKYLLLSIMCLIIPANYIGSSITVYNSGAGNNYAAEYIFMTLFYLGLVTATFITANYLALLVNSFLFCIFILVFYMEAQKTEMNLQVKWNNFICAANDDEDRLLRILTTHVTLCYLNVIPTGELFTKINKFGIYNMTYEYLPLKKKNMYKYRKLISLNYLFGVCAHFYTPFMITFCFVSAFNKIIGMVYAFLSLTNYDSLSLWNFIEYFYALIYCLLVTETVYLWHTYFIQYPTYVCDTKFSNFKSFLSGNNKCSDIIQTNYNNYKNAPKIIDLLMDAFLINPEKQIILIIWQYASNHCVSLYGEIIKNTSIINLDTVIKPSIK
eukprot:538659_1